MKAHLEWDALNDYADGAMTPDARAAAAQHLDACDNCRRDLERLREVLTAASTAPASITAPESAWSAIRATIDEKKIVAMPHVRQSSRAPSRFRLAAAAVLLIVASSTTTFLLVRRSEPHIAELPDTNATARAGEALSVSLVRMERGYINTVNELRATLDSTRARLSPETIRAVERSLKIIDDAIAEAREALVRDPASDVLRDALSRGYQQKVDLLRRASAHAATSE